MHTTEHRSSSPVGVDEAEFIDAARNDDTGRFAVLTERFRRELLAHCYRMLASYDVENGLIAEITTFGREVFARFGLPRQLGAGGPLRPAQQPNVGTP